MEKAQASFFGVLGLLLVLVIVMFYGYTSDWFGQYEPVPQGISQTQQMVSDSVIDLSRDCIHSKVMELEDHGGYLTGSETPSSTIDYLGWDVPVWQACQNDYSPDKADVTERLESAVEECLNDNAAELIESYAYQNVSFSLDGISVQANILDSKIDFDVTLPVSVHGHAISQPYPKILLPTDFGRIFSFAKDFVTENTKPPSDGGRFFESFTLLSMYHNKYLPTVGVLTECGETLHLTPGEVSTALMQTIVYVLGNTRLWEGISNDGRSFGVAHLNGNQYTDLFASDEKDKYGFSLPDGFSFTTSTPVMISNSQPLSTVWPFRIPECVTAYHQTYSMFYPIVVRAEDSLLGHGFNFAFVAYISSCIDEDGDDYCDQGEPVCQNSDECEMFISDCQTIGELVTGGACEGLGCSARVSVTNTSGDALKGATVFFDGCPVGDGLTNENGVAEGQISCDVGKLSMFYNTTYEFYNEGAEPDSINRTYVLYRNPETAYTFNEIETVGYYELYSDKEFVTSEVLPCSLSSAGQYSQVGCIRNDPSYSAYIEFEPKDRSDWWFITNIDSKGISESYVGDFESCRDVCSEAEKPCNDACVSPPLDQTQEECEDECGDDYDGCVVDCSMDFAGVIGVLKGVIIDYMHAGEYGIDAELWDYLGMHEVGGFKADYELQEDAENLFVNMPLLGTETYDMTDWQKECLVSTMETCGIDPISDEEPADIIIASCSCKSLKYMAQYSGCLTEEEISQYFCSADPPNYASKQFPGVCSYPCIDYPCTVYCDSGAVRSIFEERCGAELMC